MALITIYHTWIDGITDSAKITADRLNTNFSRVYDLVNGLLDDANIKDACNIPKIDKNYTITGTWTFSAAPVLPALSTMLVCNGGIDFNKSFAYDFCAEQLAAVPGYIAGDKGRIIYCTGDNKFYGANNAAWVQLDYTGAYTGGTIRTYTAELLIDDHVDGELYFVTEGAHPLVKINIKGRKFPASFYTELAQHTHVFTGTAHNHGITDPGHVHAGIPTTTHTHLVEGTSGNASVGHTHTTSGTTGVQSADHQHSYVPGLEAPGVTGVQSDDHTHSFSGTSGDQSVTHTHTFSATSNPPSATGSTSSATTGITTGNSSPAGTNANAGILGETLNDTIKDYPSSLNIYLDATDITAAFVAAAGWAVIGDGTATHAFYTTGSGEIDVSAMADLTAPGFHVLKITEPTSKHGCRVMVHIDTEA